MGRGITGHERPHKGKTNEWYTPSYITDVLGGFDLDPCTGEDRQRDIAKRNYTIVDNGLEQPWFGRIWLNPPYGELTQIWLEKMSRHLNGIVLIFARTETRMFHKYVWPFANGIFFFKGRIKFLDSCGIPGMGSAGAPSCLISYDPQGVTTNHEILKSCGLNGKFISMLS